MAVRQLLPSVLLMACLFPGQVNAQEPGPWLRGDEALALWDDLASTNARLLTPESALLVSKSSRWTLTRERHSDVVLRFEAKAEPNSIAGLLLRALTSPKGKSSAYEVRLADTNGTAGALIHHANGREHLPVPGPPTTKPTTGDWQRYQVDCRGGVLRVWIDGTQVLHARGMVQNVGRIGYRVSRGSIAIRKFEIQEHEPTAPPVPPGILPGDSAGVTLPAPQHQARPRYTQRALAAQTQGEVWIAIIVDVNGNVLDPRVYRSLVPDLDEEAVAAARRWRFTPARLGGKPVAVQVTISLSFTLE